MLTLFIRLLHLFLFDFVTLEEEGNLSLLTQTILENRKPLSRFRIEVLPADLIPPPARPDVYPCVRVWVLSRIARGRSISRYALAPHRAAPACSSWVVGLISTPRENGTGMSVHAAHRNENQRVVTFVSILNKKFTDGKSNFYSLNSSFLASVL